MPHDPEEVIDFAMREHARQSEEIRKLNGENAALRDLLIDALRQMKEVELVLRKALDKDRK